MTIINDRQIKKYAQEEDMIKPFEKNLVSVTPARDIVSAMT